MSASSFLPTVPSDVRLWAESQLKSRNSSWNVQEFYEQLTRLVTTKDMQFAWEEITSIEKEHKTFSALELARQAVGMPQRWNHIGKERQSAVDTTIKRIASTASKLAELLNENRHSLEFWIGDGLETTKLLRMADTEPSAKCSTLKKTTGR